MLSSYTQLGFPCTRGIQLRFSSSFSSSFLIPSLYLSPLSCLLSCLPFSLSLLSLYEEPYDSLLDTAAVEAAAFAAFWTAVWTGQETGNILSEGSYTGKCLSRCLALSHSSGQVTVTSLLSSNVRGKSHGQWKPSMPVPSRLERFSSTGEHVGHCNRTLCYLRRTQGDSLSRRRTCTMINKIRDGEEDGLRPVRAE